MSDSTIQEQMETPLRVYRCKELPPSCWTLNLEDGPGTQHSDNSWEFHTRDIETVFKYIPKETVYVEKDPIACQQEWENRVSSLTDNLIQMQGVASSGSCETFIERNPCAALCELISPDTKSVMAE